ncbi:hypothetical protein [Roseovarius rhodophyticola]|uniref:Uncharacterized protein n=1 Tax=Roseovarius rhodophyticola TaxID=3080827 RepID=A0ABZ2TAJ6_9RHOB|nr:hypothetical protein [Roseovarius sp. W115]MDV2930404.1 hypothetical protein [Roseovarius sp. W115]
MRVLMFGLAMFIAGPALALSCVRPDVANTYKNAAEAEEIYVVVHGTLTFDQNRMPEYDLSDQNRPDTLIPARLEGVSLSREGFVAPFKRNISLLRQCIGPWCGGVASGVDYLVFLQKAGVDYVMVAGPCGSFAFPEPSQVQLDQARSCMRDEGCDPLR